MKIHIEDQEFQTLANLVNHVASRVESRGGRKIFTKLANKFVGNRGEVQLKKKDIAIVLDLVGRAIELGKDNPNAKEAIAILDTVSKKLTKRLSEALDETA